MNTKNKHQLQQGDVIAIKLQDNYLNNKNFEIIRDKKNRGIVLAEGEVTGHYHGIECDESDAELIKIGEEMLLNVKNLAGVTLKHQEHNPIHFDQGIWQIGQVVEKDWLSGMVNKVVD